MRDVRNAAGNDVRRLMEFCTVQKHSACRSWSWSERLLEGRWSVGWPRGLGGVSSTGEVILYVPPTLIFFFGYGLWLRPVETPIRGDHRLPFAPNPAW